MLSELVTPRPELRSLVTPCSSSLWPRPSEGRPHFVYENSSRIMCRSRFHEGVQALADDFAGNYGLALGESRRRLFGLSVQRWKVYLGGDSGRYWGVVASPRAVARCECRAVPCRAELCCLLRVPCFDISDPCFISRGGSIVFVSVVPVFLRG